MAEQDRIIWNWQASLTKLIVPATLSTAAVGVWLVLRKFGIIYQLFHKVQKESTRHGGEIVADVLKAHGVKHMFTLVGGHISPILVACEKLGIRVVDTRHEVTAVFAADAVARMSGTVGVAAVTAGPGLTNTVTAVKNAQMAESPVLLMGGAAASILKGRGALQDIDQMSLFKPLCKYCATVTKVRDIAPTLQKALQIAQSGTPGPVFVEFPIDTLYPYQMVAKEVGAKSKSKGLMPMIVNWYLQNYVDDLFAGAWEKRDVSPMPVTMPRASKSQVQKCVELVSRAKQPVIILGSQSTLPPTPTDKLVTALESMGIPSFLGGMARGLLGQHSDIQIRQKRGEALKEADVVILAGAVCDFRLGYGRTLSRKSKIIAVNRNKEQLFKNSDMFWKPTVAIQGDAGDFIVQLAAGLKGFKCDPEWLNKLRGRDQEKEQTNRDKCNEVTDQHLNPVKVLHMTEEVMDDNTIMVADGGDFVGTAAYILRPRGPLRWLDPGAFGTLGVGGGFALGAKLCRPDCDVWIIYGDGSLGYSVAEFDTFTRHKTPVIALVGNDAGWTQISREQVPMFGSNVACQLAFSDYETVAVGYGGKGLKLDRNNEGEMEKVLREAMELSRQGHSVLVNALIGKTNFREGSISV
ncbi:2-hydroxyacyl-CoA lyase 2-like [Mya arenaria]|uniref:2-hydroxyacyl-CoA lyase 2-like n=1 Tax=Mya arenaria TaxID=6604 RepID=UPI0022E7186F|nr:2-hydroxyacyl-CoA lyase 2-like [Mya arenaria]